MSENTITLTSDDAAVKALVTTIRAEAKAGERYAAYVAAHNVTHENVKEHARALVALAFPSDKPVQTDKDGKRTRYGNAVNTTATGLKRALGKEEKAAEPGVIRISLSGEGGGTVTLREGDAGYTLALQMVTGEALEFLAPVAVEDAA